MPEGVPRLVASASGAPASGIETVTGVPVRCMNRVERLVGLLAARRPEPAMTVARSVADVLDEHVVFEVESIDRMYLNVWQPRLDPHPTHGRPADHGPAAGGAASRRPAT